MYDLLIKKYKVLRIIGLNIKIKSIIFLVLPVLLMASSVFGSNIGRSIYGVYTETYNGVGIDDPSAGTDRVTIDAGGTVNGNYESDFVEGTKSFMFGKGGWIAFRFVNGNQNMNDYSNGRIYFSAKIPSSGSPSAVNIKVKDTAERSLPFDSTSIKRVDNPSSTGVTNDGAWHTYYVSLSAFPSLDPSKISCPIIFEFTQNFSNSNNVYGFVDNVYWTKSSFETGFSVKLKNISDNQVVTNGQIRWNSSAFRKSWTAAEQYIELDWGQIADGEFNWYVQIYTDNGTDKKGLYNVDEQAGLIVLPIAARVYMGTLPNNQTGDTYIVSECNYGLYDGGRYSTNPWIFPWLLLKDVSEISATKDEDDSSMIWSHNATFLQHMWDGDLVRSQITYVKNPRIYFAADCRNALGGDYTSGIVVKLAYE